AANSRVYEEGIFKNIWIQPAAGDAGGAIGAAYAAYFLKFSSQAQRISSSDLMHGSFLGPEYSDTDIQRVIDLHEAIAEKMEDFDQLVSVVSKNLAEGQIVGWFQGRMEFGPRALGNRSILADPGIRGMQQIINQKTKFREGFRPFAPSVLEEDADKFFEPGDSSPYMLFLKKIKTELRKKAPDNAANLSLRERLAYPLSTLPAVTHVDYSARAHTVNQSTNPKFWQLLTEFKRIKGYGVLVNTSFNVRGEPIVCTPEDAFLGFMRMEMDCLVLGNFILEKKRQRIVATKTVHLLSD
ncbi:MAG TPA: carbamoyltransferase C-terminal domain-containing protein, partial [Puia sp.]|nr:carbamoyltransferase C-terminal domain-containing protein [Puia sp.]